MSDGRGGSEHPVGKYGTYSESPKVPIECMLGCCNLSSRVHNDQSSAVESGNLKLTFKPLGLRLDSSISPP